MNKNFHYNFNTLSSDSNKLLNSNVKKYFDNFLNQPTPPISISKNTNFYRDNIEPYMLFIIVIISISLFLLIRYYTKDTDNYTSTNPSSSIIKSKIDELKAKELLNLIDEINIESIYKKKLNSKSDLSDKSDKFDKSDKSKTKLKIKSKTKINSSINQYNRPIELIEPFNQMSNQFNQMSNQINQINQINPIFANSDNNFSPIDMNFNENIDQFNGMILIPPYY